MIPANLPEPEIFAADVGEPSLRWGVIGPGWIASEFVSAVRANTSQHIVAVGSRSLSRASAFANEHGIEHAVEGVDALVTRDDVDVVYIATPQSEHASVALQAIAAGKHVLVEKPFTVTAAEARQVADAARSAGVLAMEGMWSRYLPQASVVRALVRDGALGDVRTVLADHGQAIAFGPEHRLFRPELGGGALLDLGIYAVQFASMALGNPTSIAARGEMTESGVDATASLVLGYAGAATAVLHTTIAARTPTTGSISGTAGTIAMAGLFYTPTSFTLTSARDRTDVRAWTDPTGLRGFEGLAWEANALAKFVGEGRTESPLQTLDETVSIIETIDTARAQIAAG